MFVLFNYYTIIEKLLNLLNEYESESWILKDEDIVKVGCDDYGLPCIDSYKLCIISKSYGFIDWLVKNDKIKWSEKTAFVTFLEREINANRSDALVSLLAVKDNPIEYLCGILK